MKSLNQTELQTYVDHWGPQLSGAQLQDVWTDGQVVVLELRRPAETGWLCLDLHPSEPALVWITERPPFPKKPKPVTLFLASHAENRRLLGMQVRVDQGRVLELTFGGGPQECQLVFCLIPKFVNLSVFAEWDEEKKGRVRRETREIHWHKPRTLPPAASYTATSELRKSVDFIEEWWRAKGFRAKAAAEASAPVPTSMFTQKWLKEIGKKEKALLAIQEDLAKSPWERWRKFGESLKDQTQDPTTEWADLYDKKISRFANMEKAFAEAKGAERKSAGKWQRVKLLQGEIAELQVKLAAAERGEVPAQSEPTASRGSKTMQKSESRGRRRVLPSGLEAVMGKSAQDNLQILRGARAWDLWLHLRDYPGAHAIIFREKGQSVSDHDLALVGTWIWQQTKGTGSAIDAQLRLDLLVAECRFVRPVKGSPGLVTHQNARVFTFRPTEL